MDLFNAVTSFRSLGRGAADQNVQVQEVFVFGGREGSDGSICMKMRALGLLLAEVPPVQPGRLR